MDRIHFGISLLYWRHVVTVQLAERLCRVSGNPCFMTIYRSIGEHLGTCLLIGAFMKKKVYRVRGKYLDDFGRGVVSFNHSMIPVPGLLPGELGEITLYRKGDQTLSRLVSVAEPSRDRTEDVCPHFGKCGGCQLCHMKYDRQLAYKTRQVEKLFPGVKNVPNTLGMENPTGYRHKIHATFGRDRQGRLIAGIYEEGTHRILPVTDCRIQDPVANQVIRTVLEGMEQYKIQPYNEDTGKGVLRHVLIRIGYKTGQIMVVPVVAALSFPQENKLAQLLLRRIPQITTIVFNKNDRKTSMVLGREQKIVHGQGYIEDELCGMTFRISPRSFYQVNPPQAQVLYEKAMAMAGITEKDRVLDTYCGTGTITLIGAKYGGWVTGVEVNRDAVEDARFNCKKNNVKNAEFICADAAEYMRQVAGDSSKDKYYNVVIMDPPRSGSNREFLKALARMKPERVIYISCNPVTQKTDVDFLGRYGYRIRGICPVDMFPMTVGIETVVKLQRKHT